MRDPPHQARLLVGFPAMQLAVQIQARPDCVVSSRLDVGQASASLGRTALIHLFSAALSSAERNDTTEGHL